MTDKYCSNRTNHWALQAKNFASLLRECKIYTYHDSVRSFCAVVGITSQLTPTVVTEHDSTPEKLVVENKPVEYGVRQKYDQ